MITIKGIGFLSFGRNRDSFKDAGDDGDISTAETQARGKKMICLYFTSYLTSMCYFYAFFQPSVK